MCNTFLITSCFIAGTSMLIQGSHDYNMGNFVIAFVNYFIAVILLKDNM